MEHALEAFKEARRIVVFTGAGVSRSAPANLPTYEESGLRFTEEMIRDQEPAWVAFKEKVAAAEPTATHRFCATLHEQGRLKRVYTQNIDGLHERLLPRDKVVAVHGTALDDNIVVFDQSPFDRNPHLKELLASDFDNADVENRPDLCLVLGTRLAVAPFQWFPNLVSPKCCKRFFVNRDISCVRPQHVGTPYSTGEMWGSFMSGGKVSLGHGRKVSTDVDWWSRQSKFRSRQWVIEMDSDAFCETLLHPVECNED